MTRARAGPGPSRRPSLSRDDNLCPACLRQADLVTGSDSELSRSVAGLFPGPMTGSARRRVTSRELESESAGRRAAKAGPGGCKSPLHSAGRRTAEIFRKKILLRKHTLKKLI